jgi:alpha-L-glutamate ligase-like protein
MASKGRTRKRSGLLLAFRRRPNRFLQVQRYLRREQEGILPVSMYGSRDILTKEAWKDLIIKYNPKETLETIDKVQEKVRLKEAGVPIPETYLILEGEEDLESFDRWLTDRKDGFVIKPSKGHGGSGVLVVTRKVARRFILPSNRGVESSYLVRHVQRIISGHYTRKEPDRALVEERLVLSNRLRELRTPGLLDLRIVCFKGFPVMAMTRLPTKRSGGRANIHQGAIGAGISICDGKIISATYLRRTIKRHPTSGRALIGFGFNMWEEILETAVSAADCMGMGFVGVDLTVAEGRGVVVLEVNKRPGLEIQNANRAGMKRRIRWVERYLRKNRLKDGGIGPGIKVELARSWDRAGWRRSTETEPMEE